MPSDWKLLFYDNSLRTTYHRNYRLSIIFEGGKVILHTGGWRQGRAARADKGPGAGVLRQSPWGPLSQGAQGPPAPQNMNGL